MSETKVQFTKGYDLGRAVTLPEDAVDAMAVGYENIGDVHYKTVSRTRSKVARDMYVNETRVLRRIDKRS
jgi:hypothetical protein